MKYMFDTNIIIYLIKNKPPQVAQKVESLPKNAELFMSFVTYGELLKGVHGSQNSQKSQANLDRITKRVKVLFADMSVCEYYGKWVNILKTKGTPIGNNDLWIASHALAVGAVVVTRNNKEFDRVGELKVEDWTV